MKTLLILGAGPVQLLAIRRAKELGNRVIAMDGNPSAPGLKEADLGVATNFADSHATLKVAQEQKIDGILPICSDVGVVTAAHVAHEMGLSFISPQAAFASTNKYEMRKRFEKAGLSSPWSFQFEQLEEALKLFDQYEPPFILKPTDAAGARGVRKIDTRDELKGAFGLAQRFSSDRTVLVEKFVEGPSVSVECLVYPAAPGTTDAPQAVVLAISDKVKPDWPYMSDVKVIYPTQHPSQVQEEIRTLAIQALDALEITQGPAHVEMIVTPEPECKPYLVEVAARGGGFRVFTDIVPFVSGVDIVTESIRLAMGEEVRPQDLEQRASVLSFFKEPPGVLKAIHGLKEATQIEGVLDLVVDIEPGQRIPDYTCGDDRIGYVISRAQDRQAAMGIIEQVEKTLQFEREN